MTKTTVAIKADVLKKTVMINANAMNKFVNMMCKNRMSIGKAGLNIGTPSMDNGQLYSTLALNCFTIQLDRRGGTATTA